MHASGRESITEYYPSRTGAVIALVFFLVMTALPGFVVFDGNEQAVMRVLGGLAMALFGFGVYAMADDLIRPQPTRLMTDHGFTYRGFPHVAWTEVDRVRLGIGRLRKGGRAELFAEVVLRDPAEFRGRVQALGDVVARRHADRPLFIVAERLPVPVPEVVESMREHHPGLIVSTADDAPADPPPAAPPRSPDRDMVESALVSALTDILPADWGAAVLWFSLVGDDGHAGVQLDSPDADPTEQEPSEEILMLLNRLKEVCYDQMTGTWLSGQLVLRADSTKAQFTLSFKEIPDWLPLPDPAECRRELATYPRAGDEIPTWLRQRIG
ncbi:hypothetical protein [Nocardia seriolae]|uniref:Uncharacterized protein n=1 Tax=Nocardia seriolae TaxID=37332 RepID=A0A0B8NJ79_9NOCA|nr:hypothetical protein [Nocardia seriolae]APA95740.1 hypothetical protein NS506_01671 [Nocardia seriolae]MTJ66144.1 hypothetical protein [Nocardia seriolae]MTJ73261.1 hypothetical protein [Nocardia seriolae]MTJ85941.1 hypothetical protein [Nocardia seriolae]MTK29935.1 hypothetical protein [Nocardia seriolae]